MTDNLCTITFQPEGRTARVPPGTLLQDAASRAGVHINAPCGAQGRCGRCKVKVEQGAVAARESPHLTAAEKEQGWVLSCLTRVRGDVTITVPPQKVRQRVVGETPAAKAAGTVHPRWDLDPLVRHYRLALPPPSLEDPLSDVDRLQRALMLEHNIERLVVRLPALRKLARTLRDAQWEVVATVQAPSGAAAGHETHLLDLAPASQATRLLGLAIDIGTTTVVAYLVDLSTGRLLDTAAEFNAQIACGEDVISRIVYAQKGPGLDTLRELVVRTINDLIATLAGRNDFAPHEIGDVVVAGNTTMTHLFLGLYPRSIREEPYVPTASSVPVYTAGEVGLNVLPEAAVECLPAVAAYVGGDITAGVLSSGIFRAEQLTIFMDVGTNGEIVLGNADWLMTCACSAGPAFEGAGVQCGMRATDGAIEDVNISSVTFEPTLSVIGDLAPQGICGSGMIAALAELFLTGIVDRTGRFNLAPRARLARPERLRSGDHGPEYVLVFAGESGSGQDIVLTEVDINNLVRVKASIYAGITSMLRNVGIDVMQVERVLIGGGFGQHINVEQAIQIGLLPDLPWEHFRFLGNTSAQGAYQVLVSQRARAIAREIAGRMTYLELIADTSYMDDYTSALFLPHTNLEAFPSVKELVEKKDGNAVER